MKIIITMKTMKQAPATDHAVNRFLQKLFIVHTACIFERLSRAESNSNQNHRKLTLTLNSVLVITQIRHFGRPSWILYQCRVRWRSPSSLWIPHNAPLIEIGGLFLIRCSRWQPHLAPSLFSADYQTDFHSSRAWPLCTIIGALKLHAWANGIMLQPTQKHTSLYRCKPTHFSNDLMVLHSLCANHETCSEGWVLQLPNWYFCNIKWRYPYHSKPLCKVTKVLHVIIAA